MTKTLLLAAIGSIALVVNPFFGCDALEPAYSYDASDMRIAVEGTWTLHVSGEPDVTLKITQSARAERHAMHATLVDSASACGTRSFVRNAGACMDISEMPLDVQVAGMTTKRPPKGGFVVPGFDFHIGILDIEVDNLDIHARITPTGTVEDAVVSIDMARRSASLVRVR